MCLSRSVKSGIFAAVLLFAQDGLAQCSMCRAAIETEGDSTKAEALNDGIVYLMIMPYLLVGLIGFIIYRMRKNRQV